MCSQTAKLTETERRLLKRPYFPEACPQTPPKHQIDSVGLGIRTIFGIQRDNGFPALAYEIEKEPRSVVVTIPGLPEGSNWVLPESRKKVIGAVAPINAPLNEPLNPLEILLEAIRRNPGKRKQELAVITGLNLWRIKRLLANELVEKVEYRGSKKAGGYYFLDNPVNSVNPV